MGVPRLFPYIINNFPKAVKHFKNGDFFQNVDYLYLDANGLLHGAAQIIENYGPNKRLVSNYQHLSEEMRCKLIYSKFFDNIRRVTDIVRPNKVLYIAIDGTAPLAKQCQQRQRRFVAAKSFSKEDFNSNQISPGTVFMHNMSAYMKHNIRKEMNNEHSPWRNLKVYFSPPTVPGEGEHKCLDFIRKLSEKERKESSHCLFGPDGDLIMLTLSIHIPNMYLFREDLYNPSHYHLLNMGMIRKDMGNFMGQNTKRKYDDIVDDFIFQGFFVGNDFLPRIQMFYSLEDGLTKMLSVYQKNMNEDCKNVLIKDGKLNLKSFSKFIKVLAEEEEYYLSQQVNVKPVDEKFLNVTLHNNVIVQDTARILNYNGYRKDYYEKMGIQLNSNESKLQIENICFSYIKTLIWILEYYTKGLPSWKWAYEYHYAPLMSDLSKYIIKNVNTKDCFKFECNSPSIPFEQLLSILPSSSSYLVPKPYNKLMIEPSSKLVKLGYYPKDFKIDYEGKTQEYQGVVILPFVKYDIIHDCYEKMNKHVKTKYDRNIPGKDLLFTYNDEYKVQYSSKYGIISDLRIKCVEI